MKWIKKNEIEETNFWVSYTDLVTGFFIVFMLFTLVLLANWNDPETIPPMPDPPYGGKYLELVDNFRKKFEANPNIEVTDEGTVRFFDNDQALFLNNDWHLTRHFKTLMDEFIPVYFDEVKAYMETDTSYTIKEIRIEGHASSPGSYYHNLKLTNLRAYEVMKRVLNSDYLQGKEEAFQKFIGTNMISCGYSNTRLLDREGNHTEYLAEEDQVKSRRVEFRIIREKINAYENPGS